MAFEQHSQEIAHKNDFYTVYKEAYTLPNGKLGTYYAVRNLRTAFIVPMLDANTVILTKQFRYLYQADSWEFPAGSCDDGETPEQAAHRELEEEAGYTAGTMQYVGWFAPCNGLTDEQTSVFVATDLVQTQQKLDDSEHISVHAISIDEFTQMIENNTARDGMTITAWTMSQPVIRELFGN